ncbi:MAG: hypothetical protein KDB03_23015 [Planctomycetales bacterium]|nr:hypothetical protein [Planctomycetales bacterium]
MTLLGKVFTGIVGLLSVIFFTLAVVVNASHINQKDRAEAAESKSRDLQNKNDQLASLLEETKSSLAVEQAARRSALASLQTQIGLITDELGKQQEAFINLQSAHTTLVQTEKATAEELKAKSDDNELLRQQLVKSVEDRNQLMQRLASTKDSMNRLQGDKETLEERWRQLAADFTSAKEKLEILGIKADTLIEAPPAVNGEVLAVSNNNMVEVSLGRDDGMREGFTLEAHRSGQYLGRLVVRTVADDKSVAEVLPRYQRGFIRPGDRVDSKLY